MIYIPEQHYIGFQHRVEGSDKDTADVILGFATPYATDKAFEKRKSTVDSWANGYMNLKANKPGHRRAEILDNKLMSGFEIARSVRRYGWNGGNVLWRIADPRGFELEISSANLASILDCATIVNGVIQGNCIWGRDGAANILLPEMSEPYQEAVKLTQLKNDVANKKVSIKDIHPGSIITLVTGEEVEYLGKFYLVMYDYIRHDISKYAKVVERYAYKDCVDNPHKCVVKLVSNLKVAGVVNNDNVLSTQTVEGIVNKHIVAERFGKYVYATMDDIKKEKLSIVCVPTKAPTINDLKYATTTKNDNYNIRLKVTELYVFCKGISNGDTMRFVTHQDNLKWNVLPWHARSDEAKTPNPNLYPYANISVSALAQGQVLCLDGNNYRYGNQIVDISDTSLTWFKLQVMCGDITIDKLRA